MSVNEANTFAFYVLVSGNMWVFSVVAHRTSESHGLKYLAYFNDEVIGNQR